MSRTAPRTFVLVLALASITAAPARAQATAMSAADSAFARRDYRTAATAYATLVREQPTAPRAWMRLAYSRYELADFRGAAEAFERAASLAPGNVIAVYNAAASHARARRTDDAFAWLARAAATGAFTAAAIAADTDFVAMRDDVRWKATLDAATKASTPCAVSADSRRFDFWVGEWDVQTAQGQPVGSSVVQPVSGQCALLENWTSSLGGTGKSLNAYNSELGRWQQFWVGQHGEVTEYRESSWRDATLELLARSGARDSANVIQRLSFTPVSSDVVRQHGERSTDGGATWTTTYDFYYHRKR
jgi:tetratricopeptide (TPR) repeat protein